MMTIQKILFFICLILSSILAMIGFRQVNLWYFEIAIVICTVMWVSFRKKAPSFFLVISTGIAATGILLGAKPVLMILYAGLSFASWDLNSMELLLARNASGRRTDLYHSIRIKSLVLVLLSGIILILFCRLINIELPFFVITLFVVIALYCINRILKLFK